MKNLPNTFSFIQNSNSKAINYVEGINYLLFELLLFETDTE